MPVFAEIYATTDVVLDDREVRLLARDLVQFVPDYEMRVVVQTGRYPLTKVDLVAEPWHAEDLPPVDAATILEVNWGASYYGQGYERGYWPEFAAVIEFLRHRVPSCRVWYGSENGSKPVEMTQDAMENIWHYWSVNGGRPYATRYKLLPHDGLPPCSSCQGATEFLTFGAADGTVVFCPSCGQMQVKEKDQSTWENIEPWKSLL